MTKYQVDDIIRTEKGKNKMRVKLLKKTQVPIDIMYVAARTCYSAKSPIELVEECIPVDKQWKLVKQVLSSGHTSIAEHVNMSFAIEGISRACSHQLVRHRHCTFSQQSQRYVEIKEDRTCLLVKKYRDLSYLKEEYDVVNMLDKYFIWDHNNYTEYNILKECLYNYLYLIQVEETKPEEARAVLPNCTKTNLVMTCNLAELMHICNLRLCTRAQREIRDLFGLIKKEVTEWDPLLGSLLVPSCEVHGLCFEHKSCGRKPTFKQVKEDLKELASAELHRMNNEMIVEELSNENI